jgi:hypothetical protein
MHEVEYYQYRVRDQVSGKWYRTRCKMDEQTAAERYPERERLDDTRELRQILDPGDPAYGPSTF